MVLASVGQAAAQQPAPAASDWPRQREANGHSLLMWKPQVDSWENHARLVFRAAVAVRPAGKSDYVYGVVTVEANTQTDVDRRVVLATGVQRHIRFSNVQPDEAASLVALADAIMPPRESVQVPLDVVLASVRSESNQQRAAGVNPRSTHRRSIAWRRWPWAQIRVARASLCGSGAP